MCLRSGRREGQRNWPGCNGGQGQREGQRHWPGCNGRMSCCMCWSARCSVAFRRSRPSGRSPRRRSSLAARPRCSPRREGTQGAASRPASARDCGMPGISWPKIWHFWLKPHPTSVKKKIVNLKSEGDYIVTLRTENISCCDFQTTRKMIVIYFTRLVVLQHEDQASFRYFKLRTAEKFQQNAHLW